MLIKISTYKLQISFLSKQSRNCFYKQKQIKSNKNYDLTSQVPIFKTVAGKLEALSLLSAAAAEAEAEAEPF